MKNKLIVLSFLFFIIFCSKVMSFPFQRIYYYQTKDTICGTYVLESCETSRFKLKIIKNNHKYFYIIYDRKKIISKGKAEIDKKVNYTSYMFGLIGALNVGKDIKIQNYGNAMNEFIHFTQCDEKYLTFIKH